MKFTNNSGARLIVEVYNQTDRVTMVPRWSTAVDEREGRNGKRWVEALRDRGQSVEIAAEGTDLVVSATLEPDHDLANWMGNLAPPSSIAISDASFFPAPTTRGRSRPT